MTVQHPTPTPQPATPNPLPSPIEVLRDCMDKAIREADDLGKQSGRDRENAQKLLNRADQYRDKAMIVRAQAETWKRLMEGAIAEAENEQRALQAQRAELARRTRVTRDSNGQPMVLCGPYGCERPIRPATLEEQAAAMAGQALPDTRRDCPDCGIEAAAQRVETATP